METIAKIIGILFMSRTYSHMAHLKTSSYSKHKALNEFYDEIVDLTDELAEAAQGRYGKLDIPYIDLKGDVNDPVKGLESHLTMIQNLTKKCEDRTLGGIADTINAQYFKTLYLLKELN